MALGKTARFYRKNRGSYLKKLAKANSHPVWGEQTPKRKIKRVESARKRREADENGINIKDKDYDHKQKRFIDSSKNRGQSESSRRKGSKRNKGTFGKAIKKALK